MAGNSKCPRCGATLEASVASGVCPACLLKQVALGTGGDSFPAMPWIPPSVEELASAFPQLEVLSLIGHGGMGAVYKARQKSLGRLVALKILAPQHAANPDFAERFAREAKVLAEVSHPNIVTVHDFGQAGEFYFLTMEFVDGVNLRQAMTAGRLTPQQALAIVPPICEALQFAHDRGIVHRDIKPENLLLDKEGRIKIADFGIARMLRADGSHARQSVGESDSASAHALASVATKPDLTQESVLGTPSYMAPEQRERPASVDHRADIFSLGVVLYEMLTGELPGSKLQPPSKKVQIDVRLDEVVLRALEQQPELRFQTASEFRTQVTTFVQHSAAGPPSKPIGGLPLRSDGHFTTPKRLKTFWGQLFFHHYGAQFSINAQQLTIRHGGVLVPSQEISIPLAAIQDVCVGRYPALVNLHGLDYVQVTYVQESETQQLYFTPRPDRWTPLSGVNQHVSEWCEAIRAVKDGREPVIKATVGPSSASNPAVSPHERQRGFLFLALSVFFVLMFLLGGGVVTSSNGGYWTAVFFAAFVTGLLFPGILVYRSAVASACNVASPTPVRTNRSLLVQRLGSSLFLAISGPAWFYFFRSRAFASSFGQHTFLIFMGFGLAQFIPLGLGFIHRERRQSVGNEKPLDVISAKWSQRQAMGLVACFFGLTILLELVRWPAAGPPARSFEEFAGLCFAVCVLMAIVMGGVAASLRLLQASRQGDIDPDRAKSWWCLRAAAAGGTTPRSAMLRLLLAACLVIVVMWLAVRGVWTNSSATEVTIRQAAVENGHFTFGYSVQNVPGWNVWLTLENAQLFMDDGSTDKPTEPVIVSRYQAKLTGSGRVRVPLEYRPASDEGRSAVTLPPSEGHVFSIGLNQGASLLAYQTESLMRVWAIMTVLPEGQTPDSLLINEPTGSPASPRYKTVEPPAQPKLGPFEGTYEQGRIEILALSDHPPSGQPHWKPNGEPLTEAVPELGGSNTASGKIMKEIVVRVHSTTKLAATPALRFRPNSGFSAMGSSFHRPDDKQSFARFHSAIACPPQAQEMTIEVGVADGEWRKEIEFTRHDNQPHSGRTTSGSQLHGTWSGSVRSASIVGDRVPLAFSYSRREDFETRMTYERDDGTIVPLVGEGSDSNGDMTNALTTLSAAEFQRIKHFRVESRRYQWVEFRNVSLHLGHRTQVEVQSAGLFFPSLSKPLEVTTSEKPASQSPAPPTPKTWVDGDTVLFLGQVLDAETQRPVAGAEIISRFREYDWEKQAALARADGQRIPLLAERRVTTDADGRFPVIFPLACEGRDVAIERSVWHRDFVVNRSFGDWVVLKSERDSAETQKKLGSIKLKRGFAVTGQVLDVDGSPARGVPIQVAMQYPEYLGFAPLTRTDDAGRYQVRVSSRDEHRVFVMPTHAIPQSRPITKGYGEQPIVRLERGVRIRGRVLDVAGQGVRDVVVQGNGDDSVYHGMEKPLVRVRTNLEGHFELPPLQLGTDVRVISEGWTGAWQRKGEKLPDVYLPTFAVFSPDQFKPTETTVPLEEINIDFTPVSSVKLTARCFNADGTPGDVNAELYGLSPKSERQRWRGRFDPVANQPGLFELRVPKGLVHAALDLMHDSHFKFNDATRAAPPTGTQKTVRTAVRYEIINDDDDTIEIRASTPSTKP